MKLLFVKGGRFAHKESEQWSKTYFERLGKRHEVGFQSIKEDALPKFLEGAKEKHRLLVMLDERGKALDTKSLAAKFESWQADGRVKEICFVIGGSYGFSDKDRKNAALLWALSPLTMAGDVAWLVVAEQVYRALSFLEGSPYHHG